MQRRTGIHGAYVLELGGRAAVGVAGSLLAGAGAHVIRVTSTEERSKDRLSKLLSDGKEDLALDWNGANGLKQLHELVARADILLISSDLDPERVACIEPREGQIVCDITAGVSSGEPLNEWQLQAASGLIHTTGWPDQPPKAIAIPIVNDIAGFYAAAAILSHIVSGNDAPVRIDVSMLEAGFVTLNSYLAGVLQPFGRDPARVGNRHTAVAPWNSYPTRDGAVIICAGNHTQWHALCQLMRREDLAEKFPDQDLRLAHIDEVDAAIADWTSNQDTRGCEARLLRAGIAAGRILRIGPYPKDDNLKLRGVVCEEEEASGKTIYLPALPIGLRDKGRPVHRYPRDLLAQPVKLSGSLSRLPAPLAGLKVIEMGQFTTAPLCGRILAALGAEVIKIEKPGGDEQRHWQGGKQAIAETFWLNNTGKSSLCLDLRRPNDQHRLAEILSSTDLLVENFKPGTLAKFGFEEARLRTINPKLVHCAISGFGEHSCYPGRPGFDMVIQGMSGFMSAVAPNDAPIKSGISVADMMGALAGLVASLAALARREQDGGVSIDLSMQDVTAWLTAPAWNNGHALDPQPVVLAAMDGYIAAAIEPGSPLSEAPREDLARLLRGEGITNAPIRSLREAAFSPPLNNGNIWKLFDHDGQKLPVLGLPFQINGQTFLKFAPAPILQDQDPEQVFAC